MTHTAGYIEAAVNGLLVASIYLPNVNPAPGPKFDDKLRWFDRLIPTPPEVRCGFHCLIEQGWVDAAYPSSR